MAVNPDSIEWLQITIEVAIPALVESFKHLEWPIRRAVVSAFGHMAQNSWLSKFQA
jgi:hypothetical protein